MKKFRLAVAAVATVGLIGSSLFMAGPISARTIPNSKPAAKVTVGLVTDKGGLNDKSFNHLAYVGLTNAEKTLGVGGAVLQSKTAADYEPNLTKFAQQKKSLIIAVGCFMENARYSIA